MLVGAVKAEQFDEHLDLMINRQFVTSGSGTKYV